MKGKVIFRKIGGRIIPIRVTAQTLGMGPNKLLSLKAMSGNRTVGQVNAVQWSKKIGRWEIESDLSRGFRNKGFGTKLYAKMIAMIRKHGGTSVVGITTNPAIIGVRKKFNTRFLIYGDDKSTRDPKKTVDALNKFGNVVMSVTRIPKKKR